MKWGRRSSSSISLPRLFPIPWLGKLKQLGITSQSQPAKTKQKHTPKSPKNAPPMSVCIRSPRLAEDGFPSPNAFDGKVPPGLTKFTEKEEEFWSFSFRKQQPKCSENSANSEDGLQFHFSSCRTGAKTENAGELKELVREEEDAAVGGEASLQCDKGPQEQDPKTGSHPKEKIHPSNSRKSVANTEREETKKPIGHSSSNKPKEKTQDLSPRRNPSQKVKVGMQSRSPQMASRAEKRRLRDLKKKKKKKKGSKTQECRSFESFAVAKSSFDPQKDFRESMVEMIRENRIEEPQELESLLACYLSLNSAEHHDVIVKAFQHVWLELNRSRLISELEKGYENYE